MIESLIAIFDAVATYCTFNSVEEKPSTISLTRTIVSSFIGRVIFVPLTHLFQMDLPLTNVKILKQTRRRNVDFVVFAKFLWLLCASDVLSVD